MAGSAPRVTAGDEHRQAAHPKLGVRRMMVTWVWLMYGGVLCVVAVMTSPEIVATPAAFGPPFQMLWRSRPPKSSTSTTRPARAPQRIGRRRPSRRPR